MPKKPGVDRALVRINISERAHKYLLSRRHGKEPLYVIFNRILAGYGDDNAARDWEDLYHQQIETTKTWMNRAIEAEAKIRTVGLGAYI